ncbi:MAG TPA: family 43 glycosylhydrolase [Phycisphaerae bacterium]|nr:family 43 glycosylhydrolase [Phycisphaerae bacterium]HOJ73444.1 family 43 glycosylhydrolase [Phycisphaerae bacterium]HOM51053.1 family 43 glycosylhydrolase [Phycisphaerae bacterium]HPP25718.1 family 43 glycosylhydrolase [Phycisphaerae bacterium]HPU27396.1 family 43 glycosylhydrolase [Phycisphaerae bacterium]
MAALLAFPLSAEATDAPVVRTFVNPVYEGADPWVVKHGHSYYYCRSEGDKGVSVWKSPHLTDPGVKRVVWTCPDRGWNSAQLWAPELHYVQGKWYIYYAASDGHNANHRAGVLEAVTDDPQGEYVDRGMLYTGDDVKGETNNRWAIDATPVTINGRLYLIWSGWPDERDIQYLYIARMSTPYTVASNRVKLCENDTYLWERVDESLSQRGLHEAPQVLKRDGRVLLVYSCSGSWQESYKLGLLMLNEDDDPLEPANWRKLDRPIFAPTEETYGTGHCSFVTSPDGTEDWLVYHAKRSRKHGWERAVFMQPFTWRPDGLPDFGRPVAAGQPLPVPSGETGPEPGDEFIDHFDAGNWDHWRYYGYGRYIWVDVGALSLGGTPKWGNANHYRSGEKALVRGYEWADFEASVRVRVLSGGRDAGILFRVQHPAVGYDAQKGYFAGLIPRTRQVVLGKTDGANWKELALVPHAFDAEGWNDLAVEARGDRIIVAVNGRQVITAEDGDYKRGQVGVRVVDSHARFDDFRVRKIEGE